MANIEVSGLVRYPIKSCAAENLAEAAFTEYGIQYDREWVLTSPQGVVRTQRTVPELALVTARIATDALLVTAPGFETLAIPLERDEDSTEIAIDLWKKPGTATLEKPEVSKYFSDFIGKPTLVSRIKQPRIIRPEGQVAGASKRTAFSDGAPILLTAEESLAQLNTHMDEPVTMDRFRPNIIVRGGVAYEEDTWREMRIGNLSAFVGWACARCPMPNIDQTVGILPGTDERFVSIALRQTRRGDNNVNGDTNEVFFGQNVVHRVEDGAIIKIGDPVTVVSRAATNITLTV